MPLSIRTFRRLLGPSPGIRGDHLQPKQFNEIYDELEKLDGLPTTPDVVAMVVPLVTDALANDEVLQDAVEDTIFDQDIPTQVDTAVDTKVADLSLVEGGPLIDPDDIGIVFVDPDTRTGLPLTDRQARIHPWTAQHWAPNLADPVLGEYGFRRISSAVTGYSYVVTDSDGRIAWGVTIDGEVTSGGSSSSGSIPIYPSENWVHFADSMGGGWPALLAVLTGKDHVSQSVGGQISDQIAARQGGVPARLTLSGGSIPATTTPVTVTAIARSPLSVSSSRTGLLNGVFGTLTRDSGSGHTFTRSSAGAAVPLTGQAVFITTEALAYRDRTLTITAGRNDFYDVPPERIVQTIAAMIDYQQAAVKRVIVMDVAPWAPETIGSGATRTKLDTLNTMLATSFRASFLPVFAKLRTTEAATAAGITFTANDLTDIANGVTPRSFRADLGGGVIDDGHLNSHGHTAVAYFLYQESQNRGWL